MPAHPSLSSHTAYRPGQRERDDPANRANADFLNLIPELVAAKRLQICDSGFMLGLKSRPARLNQRSGLPFDSRLQSLGHRRRRIKPDPLQSFWIGAVPLLGFLLRGIFCDCFDARAQAHPIHLCFDEFGSDVVQFLLRHQLRGSSKGKIRVSLEPFLYRLVILMNQSGYPARDAPHQ